MNSGFSLYKAHEQASYQKLLNSKRRLSVLSFMDQTPLAILPPKLIHEMHNSMTTKTLMQTIGRYFKLVQ